MNKYILSIIIPVYNVENYLEECLNSIINLDNKKIEIILIDDGSTDTSGKICDKYEKKFSNIKVVHKENAGPACARNIGISLSKGKYIFFLDSDDKIDFQEFNSFLHTILENNIDTDVFLGQKFTILFPKNTTQKRSKEIKLDEHITGEKFLEKYLSEGNFCTNYIWINIYSSKLIKENVIFFDENSKLGEDTEWNIRIILAAKKIAKINEDYYIYRGNRKGSLVTTRKAEDLYSYLCLVEKCNQMKLDNKILNKKIKYYFSEGFYSNLKYIYEYKKDDREKILKRIEDAEFLKYPNSKKSRMIIKKIKKIGLKPTILTLNIQYKVFKLIKNLAIKLKLIDR